jgi:hypothetical protein
MDIQPYGTNAHSVRVKPLDYSHPHTPSMMVYHGITIVINGSVVGRIQSWQPTNAYNRKVTSIRELSAFTFGEPVDIVPSGSEGDYTVEVQRGEVWEQEFEKVCGFSSVWEVLSDQDRPFTIMEFWMKGSKLYRIWMYTGCWFTKKDYADAWSAADWDGIINISGTIAYVKRSIAA